MTRELLLLRHGKSDWASGALDDFDRPLRKRGRNASRSMGRWLREQDLLPDHVVSSPARRAGDTALRACRAAELAESMITWEQAIYEGGVRDLLAVLARIPAAARRVLVVGHNPGLEELLVHLAGRVDAPADGKLLPTATLARLEMPDDWTSPPPGCARLLAIVRPGEVD